MKLILALVTFSFITINCENLLESLDTEVNCLKGIELALNVALISDGNMTESFILKINNDCENIFDVLVPLIKPFTKDIIGEALLTIALNSKTKKVISMTSAPFNNIDGILKNQTNETDILKVLYIAVSKLKGHKVQAYMFDDIEQGSANGTSTNSSNIKSNVTINDKGSRNNGSITVQKSDPIVNNSAVVTPVLVNESTEAPAPEYDPIQIPADAPWILKFAGVVPYCSAYETSYRNFKCESLTCENYKTELKHYQQCVRDSLDPWIKIGTYFQKWSKCQCDLGLVRYSITGTCIRPEQCPSVSTTVKPNTSQN